MRRTYKGAFRCSKDCELCEGKAYIVTGDRAVCNARTMEVEHADEISACPNAEFDEPDYEERDYSEPDYEPDYQGDNE